MAIPDSLAHRLELFRETGLIFPDAADVFRVDSWVQVLVGQRIMPRAHHFMADALGDDRARNMLATLRNSIASTVAKLPSHKQFLDVYCGASDEAVKQAAAKN